MDGIGTGASALVLFFASFVALSLSLHLSPSSLFHLALSHLLTALICEDIFETRPLSLSLSSLSLSLSFSLFSLFSLSPRIILAGWSSLNGQTDQMIAREEKTGYVRWQTGMWLQKHTGIDHLNSLFIRDYNYI